MNLFSRVTGSLFLFFLIFTSLFFFALENSYAQTATSCWTTDFGNPSSDFPLPEGCGSMRRGVTCPSNEPKYVCAYRNIVDHNVRSNGSYWAWSPPGHIGVDLITKQRANPPTPIYSLEDGVVIQARYDFGGGNMYKIYDARNKRFHMGLHLIRPASVKVGDIVKRGQLIGYIGHTGFNTSPTDHLHFQISRPCENVGRNQYTCWADPKEMLKNWPRY